MHITSIHKKPFITAALVLVCLGVFAVAYWADRPPVLNTAYVTEAAADIEITATPIPTATPAPTEAPQNPVAALTLQSSPAPLGRFDRETQPYTITTAASVYKAPDPEANVLEEIPLGEELALTGFIKNNMVSVRTESGIMGYIESTLIDTSIIAELTSRQSTIVKPAKAINLFDPAFESLTIEEKLKTLQKILPDGKYWNTLGADISGLPQDWACSITTWEPCAHTYNGYEYCHAYDGETASLFDYSTNIQCLGFASLVSDVLFGKDAPVVQLNDFSDLQVGDHIRFVEYEHSMIVTEVTANSVTVVQCNSDYENCMIEWGTVYSREEIEGHYDVMYISRYTEETINSTLP